jgi:hypothetical protein
MDAPHWLSEHRGGVTNEMSTASRKAAELAFPLNGAQAERKAS